MSAFSGHPQSSSARLPLLLLLVGLAWFFYAVRVMLAPFVLAAVMAYILNPVVVFFEIRGLRRDTIVLFLFAFLIAWAVLLSYWGLVAVWQDLPDLRSQWPIYMRRADEAVKGLQLELGTYMWEIQEKQMLERATTGAMAWVERNLWHSPNVVATALNVLVTILLAPFIAFFFLRESRNTAQMFLDACPGVWVERFLSLFNKIDEVLGNYTRGVIIEAVFVGIFSMLGLQYVGLNYASLIGIASGIGNMIPFFGPVLGGAVGIVVALFQFGTVPGIAKVLLVFVVVHYLDSYILQPLIMKKTVNLNPVTVVFALMAGAHLAGVWGLVFAVPVASLIKEGSVIFYDWYRAERGLISPSRELTMIASRPWVV